MIPWLLMLNLLTPPVAEGIRHDALASALENAHCRVRMSHQEWVELEPGEDAGPLIFQPPHPQPVQNGPLPPPQFAAPPVHGTPIVLQSTLPHWVDSSKLHYAIRRIDQVTIRGKSEETVEEAVNFLADFDPSRQFQCTRSRSMQKIFTS